MTKHKKYIVKRIGTRRVCGWYVWEHTDKWVASFDKRSDALSFKKMKEKGEDKNG